MQPVSRLLLMLWPVPALAVALAGSAGLLQRTSTAFFTLLMLWPASLLVGRVFGRRAGAAVGVTCAALVAATGLLPPPRAQVAPVVERPFFSAQQAARHTLRLPVGAPHWNAHWLAPGGAEAHLYVMVARWLETGDADWHDLQVDLGGEPHGRLDKSNSLGRVGHHPQVHWYMHRVAVPRARLEANPELQVTVRPAPGGDDPGGLVGLVGGFSYRPTAPESPSAFFDGSRWTSSPSIVLPAPDGAPPNGPMRYFIELRLIETASRRILATYY